MDYEPAYHRLLSAREALYAAAEAGDPVALEYIAATRVFILARQSLIQRERDDEDRYAARSDRLVRGGS